MKALLSLLVLFPLTAFSLERFNLSGFDFDYRAPYGEGRASSFSYGRQGSVELKVNKLFDTFSVEVTGHTQAEFELKQAPGFLLDADIIRFQRLELHLDRSLRASLSSAHTSDYQQSLELQELRAECQRQVTSTELAEQVIQGCIQRLSLQVRRINPSAMLPLIEDLIGEGLQASEMQNLDLKINSGRYEFVTDVRAQIPGKLRSRGSVRYDGPKKLLTVNVAEVRFGILNITGQFFDELKQKETPNFKVQRPNLFITLP
jgi:hypothetical protein